MTLSRCTATRVSRNWSLAWAVEVGWRFEEPTVLLKPHWLGTGHAANRPIQCHLRSRHKFTPDTQKGASLRALSGLKRMSLLPAPLQIPDFRAFWLARLTTTI